MSERTGQGREAGEEGRGRAREGVSPEFCVDDWRKFERLESANFHAILSFSSLSVIATCMHSALFEVVQGMDWW